MKEAATAREYVEGPLMLARADFAEMTRVHLAQLSAAFARLRASEEAAHPLYRVSEDGTVTRVEE